MPKVSNIPGTGEKIRKRIAGLILGLIFLGVSFHAFAWTPTNGPFIGPSSSVISDPDGELYTISRRSELFLLDQAEGKWKNREIMAELTDPNTGESGYKDCWLDFYEIAPGNANVIYADADPYGALRSVDGGQAWTQISNGLPYNRYGYWYVDFIYVDPTNEDVAYALLDNGYGLYKTVDGGANWTKIFNYNLDGPTDPPYDVITDLAIDPTDTQILYRSRYYTGVEKSTDGGQTWVRKNTGFPYWPWQVFHLEITSTASRVYAGTHDYGLWATDNGAENWGYISLCDPVHHQHINGIKIDPANPWRVYVGMYCQESDLHYGLYIWNGSSWEQHFPGEHSASPGYIDPITLEIYALVGGRWYVSPAGGVAWEEMNTTGIRDTLIYSTSRVYNEGDEYSVYTTGEGPAVHYTSDSGDTWELRINGLPTGNTAYYDIRSHPTDKNCAYIGLLGNGVYKTTDGGLHWTPKNSGMETISIWTLDMGPSDTNILYAGGQYMSQAKLFKTTDGGESWTDITENLNIPFSFGSSIAHLRISPRSSWVYIIVAVDNLMPGLDYRVVRSKNGGSAWKDITGNLPAGGDYSYGALGPSHSKKNVVYIIVHDYETKTAQVWRRKKNKSGKWVWRKRSNGLPAELHKLIVDPTTHAKVIVGTAGEGIYETADNGKTWFKVSEGLGGAGKYVKAISITHNAEENRVVFLGTKAGIYKKIYLDY